MRADQFSFLDLTLPKMCIIHCYQWFWYTSKKLKVLVSMVSGTMPDGSYFLDKMVLTGWLFLLNISLSFRKYSQVNIMGWPQSCSYKKYHEGDFNPAPNSWQFQKNCTCHYPTMAPWYTSKIHTSGIDMQYQQARMFSVVNAGTWSVNDSKLYLQQPLEDSFFTDLGKHRQAGVGQVSIECTQKTVVVKHRACC